MQKQKSLPQKSKVEKPEDIDSSHDEGKSTSTAYDRKQEKRKGKGSKQKSFEKFRMKKNIETQKGIDKMIDDFRASLMVNVPKTFGSRVPPSVTRPAVEVPIDTYEVEKLVDNTLASLKTSGKIVITDEEVRAVKIVTAAQVETKVYYSRQGSVFRNKRDLEQSALARAELVAADASLAFSPIAEYLHQVGRFELNQQQFYPWNPEDPKLLATHMFSTSGFREMESGVVGKRAIPPWIKQVPTAGLPPLADNEVAVPTGKLSPDGLPVFLITRHPTEMIARNLLLRTEGVYSLVGTEYSVVHDLYSFRTGTVTTMRDWSVATLPHNLMIYAGLLQKCRRKFRTGGIVEVDLKTGIGTSTQLVARGRVSPAGNCRVWSSRDVGTDILTLGGICGFGSLKYHTPPIYSGQCQVVETSLSIGTAMQQWADTINGALT